MKKVEAAGKEMKQEAIGKVTHGGSGGATAGKADKAKARIAGNGTKQTVSKRVQQASLRTASAAISVDETRAAVEHPYV